MSMIDILKYCMIITDSEGNSSLPVPKKNFILNISLWDYIYSMKPLLLFLLILAAYAHTGCIHDRIISNKKLIPIDDTKTASRLLQVLPYGPIRFFYVYNTT